MIRQARIRKRLSPQEVTASVYRHTERIRPVRSIHFILFILSTTSWAHMPVKAPAIMPESIRTGR